ncbi:MAG: twin-arginine translocation signal domain-containing protein [Candidatus Binataceae bacterium]|jgi:hypothetical protein|nr:twin-arginine translocation signal domain-containing protein [Candidatus Binataceae bacterium]
MHSSGFDRRDFLKKLSAVCGGAFFIGLANSGNAEAEAKADKGLVNYRFAGCNDGRNCVHCRFFQPGSGDGCAAMMEATCKVVAGTISPMGYCDLFAATASE